jgi:protein TonB
MPDHRTMVPPPALLGWALAASILLHAGLLEVVMRLAAGLPRAPQREPAALDVRLREARLPPPLPEPVPLPRLLLPRNAHPDAIAAPTPVAAPRVRAAPGPGPAAPRGDGPQGLGGEAARVAFRQLSRALLYPREAIAQGVEGEATVLLFLDASGDAIAARLETSSGSALLDDAAVRAARTLRALPGSAPRVALLPVRFRLR